jgi:hypothetical protein
MLVSKPTLADFQFCNPTTSKAQFRSERVLKVHKIEIFFGFDFEICIISLLVMSKY